MLLHSTVGREALCDCIHTVKNRWRGRLCKQAGFTQRCLRRVLLIGDGFCRRENKVRRSGCCYVLSSFFPAGDESENKLQWK